MALSLSKPWISAWMPPDRRPIHEWAKDNMVLCPPLTRTGPPDLSSSRHLIPPLESLADERVTETNVLAPVRGGKSLISDLWLGHIVCNQPGSFLGVFQDDKAAKDHAERRALKLMRGIKDVAQYLPADRHKDRTQEIILPGMEITYTGPSPRQLQSRGYRYVCCDELWLYKQGMLAEAKGRMGDYLKLGTAKLLCLSQGGDEMSDWHLQFERGVLHEWHVQCQSCWHYMQPIFRGFRQDGSRWGFVFDAVLDAGGLFKVIDTAATARFECEACGHPHTDSPRLKSEWNRTGKYVVEEVNKNPAYKSFHWTALIDWPWIELASEYVEALNALKQGVIDPLKTFVQKKGAQFWVEQMAFDAGSRPRHRAPADTTWQDEHIRFMTIDQQGEGVQWAVIRAWSKNGESRRLWFGKMFSEEEAREKQLEYKVHDNHVLKDSGYDTRTVYGQCCKFGWISLKGEDVPSFMHFQQRHGTRLVIHRSYSPVQRGDPEAGKTGEGTRFAKLIRWSVPLIADRLEGLKQGKGPKWSSPKPETPEEITAEREYDRQLADETKRQKIIPSTGKRVWIWHSARGNNHLNDCERMQVLGATLAECLPDLAVPVEEAESKG